MTPPPESATDLSLVNGTWSLDTTKTTIAFRTKAMWVTHVVGTATALDGSAQVGADGNITGTLVIDTTSIDTKNKRRDHHLQGSDFLEVVKYPTITYAATSGELAPGGTLTLLGDLTVHGVSRPVTVTADSRVSGTTATVSAEIVIDRSEWGISWAKLGAGLENRVVVTAHFVRS